MHFDCKLFLQNTPLGNHLWLDEFMQNVELGKYFVLITPSKLQELQKKPKTVEVPVGRRFDLSFLPGHLLLKSIQLHSLPYSYYSNQILVINIFFLIVNHIQPEPRLRPQVIGCAL